MKLRIPVMALAALCVVATASWAPPTPAEANVGLEVTSAETIASGVVLESFNTTSASSTGIRGELLTVDLSDPHVSVDLLHPDSVSQAERVSEMADAQDAVAGVNGDFFNNTEAQHPGVSRTNSSVGPEIADGQMLKAAVPNAQRFGPGMPPGVTTEAVLGVGADGIGRLDTATLQGQVRVDSATLPLRGVNQYALAVGGIGAYTSEWGTTSRQRAVCGTDTSRAAPCTTDVAEVRLLHGNVTSVSDTIGAGAIAPDETVLVGREAGAAALRALAVGEHVTVLYHMSTGAGIPLKFAIGGFPILRDGEVVAGQDSRTAAVRTGAGFSADGRTMYLVAVQPTPGTGAGMTTPEVAGLLEQFGADDAMNLDGGGSTTLVARDPGAESVTVRNRPTDGAGERSVANGVGIFVD